MIVEIQCMPSPPGAPQDRYANVDAAIAVVEDSGLNYEVGPMGTSVEGEPDEIWSLLRAMHEAGLAGADAIVSVIKVHETKAATAPTIDSLTAKFRR